MAKYKVIALSVGDDYNRIHESGDIVDGQYWREEGRAEELVKQGFLAPVDGMEVTVTEEMAQDYPELGENGVNVGDTVEVSPISFEEMSVAELKAVCAERGIEIPSGSKKADLIALLNA